MAPGADAAFRGEHGIAKSKSHSLSSSHAGYVAMGVHRREGSIRGSTTLEDSLCTGVTLMGSVHTCLYGMCLYNAQHNGISTTIRIIKILLIINMAVLMSHAATHHLRIQPMKSGSRSGVLTIHMKQKFV